MIKAVVQALPTYAMSFKLPKSFCKELEGMFASFWCGQSGTDCKVHWVSWPKMCNSKFESGMSFKDLELFNL